MIVVRDALAADAGRIAEIQRAAAEITRAVYRPNSERLAARGRIYGDSVVLVALLHGAVAGTLTQSLEGGCLHLRRIAVDPDHHRRGVARALIDAAEHRARAAGARALSLETIRETGNVEIFERLGFQMTRAQPTDLFDSDRFTELTDVRMERLVRAVDDR